jgi:hypothetical protein
MHSLVLQVLAAAASVASNPTANQSHPPEAPRYDLTAPGLHRSHGEEFAAGPAFGTCLTFLPDLDEDGSPELALGDPFWNTEHGRVVIASGHTGRILGWVEGPDGEPSFGREVASLEPTAGHEAQLLIARPRGGHPAIVSVNLHDYKQVDVWKAEAGESCFGAWFEPWHRAIEGKRSEAGLVVVSSMKTPRPDDGLSNEVQAPYRISRYDLGGSLQARVELPGDPSVIFVPARVALVPGVEGDDIAVADSDGLCLLAGADLTTRWARLLEKKNFVRSICSIGDLDGDGHADLVLGCPWKDIGSHEEAGVVWLVSGADGAVIREITLGGDNFGFAVCAGPALLGKQPGYIVSRPTSFCDAIFEYEGLSPDPQGVWGLEKDSDLPHLGWRVYSAPDLDADGIADVITARASWECWKMDKQGFAVFSRKTHKALYALERHARNP